MRTVLLTLGLLAATPVLAQSAGPVIVVTAEGRVEGVPDMASVSAGVTTEGTTAAEALSANNAAMDDVFALLKSNGIADGDIQTSNLSINPMWDNSSSLNGTPKISGYQATNMVTVRVRDLAGLGEVLDSVVSGGANQLNGLTFGLTDESQALDGARKMAVDEAVRRAKLLASAAGITIGPILSITEGSGAVDPTPMYRMEMAKDSVPIAAGQVSSTVTVTVTFGIVN